MRVARQVPGKCRTGRRPGNFAVCAARTLIHSSVCEAHTYIVLVHYDSVCPGGYQIVNLICLSQRQHCAQCPMPNTTQLCQICIIFVGGLLYIYILQRCSYIFMENVYLTPRALTFFLSAFVRINLTKRWFLRMDNSSSPWTVQQKKINR